MSTQKHTLQAADMQLITRTWTSFVLY